MFYVYILESIKNGEIYTGFTCDLKKRLEEHNHKKNSPTKTQAPWRVIYYEACINKEDAMRREKYLKTSQGRRLMERRLKEYFFNKK
jgi:putative endonuclease